MEHRIKVQALGPAIVVAISVGLSLVVSTIVVAKAWQDQPEARVSAYRDITVKGKAVRRISSDHVTWSIVYKAKRTRFLKRMTCSKQV